MDAARSRSEESLNVGTWLLFVNRDHHGHVTVLVNLHQSSIPSLSVLAMEPAPVIALRNGEGLGRNLLE